MKHTSIRILFTLWLVSISIHGYGEQEKVESLKRRLDSLSEHQHFQLVKTHNELAWVYRDTRPDSALFHANSALRLARENHLSHEEIQSINYVGVAYRNLSNFSKAFEKYLEALRLSEERGDTEQKGYSLINLGNLYLYQTNFQGAIRYFIQALDQAQALANKRMVAYCFLNLGRSYKGIAEYGQAELYFKQAIDIRREQEDLYGQLAVEIDLAEVYMLRGETEKSLKYYQELIERIKASENPRLLAVAYNNVARIHLTRGQISLAESNALQAIEITRKVNSRYEEKSVLENLSMIYSGGGNYKKAFEYHVRFAELNQQLFSEENIRRIEQMKNQYEMEQQETENEFLRQQWELNQKIIDRQRIIIFLAILGVVLFLVVTIISIRAFLLKKRLSNEIKLQKDEIEKDKELIENQSQKLQELDTAKSRFFANVSHDLRTPLSLIMGNLELVKDHDEIILPAEAAKNLEIALKNCKRLLYLTDEINDLTKLEEGKIMLSRETVRLGSYLKMLTEMFTGTAEYKGIRLEFVNRLKKEDAVFIDPRQFEKIFYNLISNAIRHTPQNERITIETYAEDGNVHVIVADTGEGISSESLPYVFDRFYQSKSNGFRTREGLGIGLALVKELVDLHEGQISVESTLGLGTSFRMVFPKADHPGESAALHDEFNYVSERKQLFDELDREESAGVSIPRQVIEQDTILLVDDHPEIRYHIRQILEDEFHVIEAAHGIEALEILKRNTISLIITDLMMPWMDGFEFIEALNKSDDLNRIPVLVVSARITSEDQERVLDYGINDYLKKPFQKKELILRITNLLQQKQKWQHPEHHGFTEVFDKKHNDRLEKDILANLEQLVMDRIDDENLSVYMLADALAASERQVYRLVKKITGLTPYEYVTEIRMKYVEYLIRKGKVKNASEAARSIGLKNVTTFSRQFEKKFGVRPSELLKAHTE